MTDGDFNQKLALLAAAAYSNQFDRESIAIDRLKKAGLAKAQADWVTGTQRLALETFNDTSTGLVVTVCQHTQGEDAGKLTIGIRGTLEFVDYDANFILARKGAAFSQIVSLYNWWQRESNVKGGQ